MPPKHDPTTPTDEWFWARSVPEPNTGCLLWTGGLHGQDSRHCYGALRDHRQSPPPMIKAHVLAWELAHGPVPDGLFVCHSCDTPPCVNEAHLFLGTNQENMADAGHKGRLGRIGPKGRALTVCVHGHPYTAENTYLKPNGTRACIQCRRDANARWRQSA